MEKITSIGAFATLCLQNGKSAQETLSMVKGGVPEGGYLH